MSREKKLLPSSQHRVNFTTPFLAHDMLPIPLCLGDPPAAVSAALPLPCLNWLAPPDSRAPTAWRGRCQPSSLLQCKYSLPYTKALVNTVNSMNVYGFWLFVYTTCCAGGGAWIPAFRDLPKKKLGEGAVYLRQWPQIAPQGLKTGSKSAQNGCFSSQFLGEGVFGKSLFAGKTGGRRVGRRE